jgi:hypothetical protein
VYLPFAVVRKQFKYGDGTGLSEIVQAHRHENMNNRVYIPVDLSITMSNDHVHRRNHYNTIHTIHQQSAPLNYDQSSVPMQVTIPRVLANTASSSIRQPAKRARETQNDAST